MAFFADQERRRGNEKQAAELFEQALDLELKALDEITKACGTNVLDTAPQCWLAGFGLQ